MVEGERGWWVVEADGEPGDDYGFRLDGSGPLPDPRSPWQPDGVDGMSRLVDHDAFGWTDDGWRGLALAGAVLYELHVGTFSPEGTFDGVIGRLDHLVDLGVDAVELLPVGQFSGDRNWGYDGVDLYAPHAGYGGPDGLKRLVDACHAKGLGVILDVVYNHLGPEGNHLARFGPYFTDFYATPWGRAVNYDRAGSDEVRRFVIDNALQWLRHYHLDGLRLDAVHAIIDTSATHVLAELAEEVERLAATAGKPLFLIGESDLNDPKVITDRSVGGWGLDAQWSDNFHHALHAVLTGEREGYYEDFGSLADLAEAFEGAWVRPGRYSAHRDRVHGRPHGGLPGWRFLAYSQNHDQVGNRAAGDRPTATLSPGRARIAAALTLLSPFVPMLFQGEEWGASTPFQYFTSHEDHELGRAVAQGRRSEFAAFGWKPEDVPDPQDQATFARSKLDWRELEQAPHRELLDWYRALLRLRRTVPDLGAGPLTAVYATADEASGRLVVRRGRAVIDVDLAADAMRVVVDGEVALRFPSA
jgi:maltooligosyltrehalose trehalohydrolase